MKAVADWLDEYRGFWEGSLDRLDEYLAEIQAETPKAEIQKAEPQKSETQTEEKAP